MSEAPKNGNGGHTTPSGMLASVSEKLIRVLPPAFILLIVLNIMFLGMATWMYNQNTEVRNVMLTRIIEGCLLDRAKEQLQQR